MAVLREMQRQAHAGAGGCATSDYHERTTDILSDHTTDLLNFANIRIRLHSYYLLFSLTRPRSTLLLLVDTVGILRAAVGRRGVIELLRRSSRDQESRSSTGDFGGILPGGDPVATQLRFAVPFRRLCERRAPRVKTRAYASHNMRHTAAPLRRLFTHRKRHLVS